MIMLCERCCGAVEDGEPKLQLAHIDQVHTDGAITWRYSYVHIAACPAPRLAPHERPDPGAWDSTRSIGSHRT